MKKMYALIIEGCYCGSTHIYGIYESLYDAIVAARDWIDDNISEDNIPSIMKEFVISDFLYVDSYFTIDEFEM